MSIKKGGNINISSYKNIKDIRKITDVVKRRTVLLTLRNRFGTLKMMASSLKTNEDAIRTLMAESGVYPFFKSEEENIFIIFLNFFVRKFQTFEDFKIAVKSEFSGCEFQSIQEFFEWLEKVYREKTNSDKKLNPITVQEFARTLNYLNLAFNMGTAKYKPSMNIFSLFGWNDEKKEKEEKEEITIESEPTTATKSIIAGKDDIEWAHVNRILKQYPNGRFFEDGPNIDFFSFSYGERCKYLQAITKNCNKGTETRKIIDMLNIKLKYSALGGEPNKLLFVLAHKYVGYNDKIRELMDEKKDLNNVQNFIIDKIVEFKFDVKEFVLWTEKYFGINVFSKNIDTDKGIIKSMNTVKVFMKRHFGLEIQYGSDGNNIDKRAIRSVHKQTYQSICSQSETKYPATAGYEYSDEKNISSPKNFFYIYKTEYKTEDKEAEDKGVDKKQENITNITSKENEEIKEIESVTSVLNNYFRKDLEEIIASEISKVMHYYKIYYVNVYNKLHDIGKYDLTEFPRETIRKYINDILTEYKNEYIIQQYNIGNGNEYWEISKSRHKEIVPTEVQKEVKITNDSNANTNSIFLPSISTEIFDIENDEQIMELVKIIKSKLIKFRSVNSECSVTFTVQKKGKE